MNDIILDEDFGGKNAFDAETTRKINLSKIRLNEAIEGVKKGRIIIFLLCGFVVLSTAIAYFSNPLNVSTADILVEVIVLLAIYLSCALLYLRNPLVCLIVTLSTYLLVQLLIMLVDPLLIFQGVLFKILFIYYFAKGIQSALTLKKEKKKLRRLGISEEELEPVKRLELIAKTAYQN